jgi:trans-aconitate methyltransferase
MAGNPMMFGAARPVLLFLKEHPELLVRLLDRSQPNAVKADVFGHREPYGL